MLSVGEHSWDSYNGSLKYIVKKILGCLDKRFNEDGHLSSRQNQRLWVPSEVVYVKQERVVKTEVHDYWVQVVKSVCKLVHPSPRVGCRITGEELVGCVWSISEYLKEG